jgi:hypothetical protein
VQDARRVADNDRVNLSDKSPTRPRSAVSSAAPAEAPLATREPKAKCARCGRPVVLAKAPTCLYCGAPLTTVAAPMEKSGTIPPHVLLALEPRVHKMDARRKWLIRVGASLLGSLITGLIMGPCAKITPHN